MSVCMKYLVYVAQEFKVFVVTIKTEEPKVHMTNFLPTDAFMNDPKSDGWLQQKEELLKFIKLEENYRVLLVPFSLKKD